MDKTFFQNPFTDYLHWLKIKISFQRKNKAKHLRIGYMALLKNVTFGQYNWTGKKVYIENTSIGDFSYISDGCVIQEATIGKFCSFGPNILIAPGKHPTKTFVSTHPALFSNPTYCQKNFFDKDYHNPERHVTIGNDVWICANVVITDGVTIGDGAIIGANAVVTTDIEPYSIVGGVPAKLIRKRFEENEIDYLLNIKWWNKDLKWIEKNASRFLDIKKFVLVENE
jgi:chloramphenicol O-acetyltransferase type B